MIKNISVVIIAHNAEKTLKSTLDSLIHFEDVVVYVNNSTDNTVKIIQDYKNVHMIEGDFLGFGPTKNLASTYAKNEWIFSLDSDEVVTPSLYEELTKRQFDNPNTVFILKRDNYFFEKHIKHSGWGNDYLVRIYNRTQHQFNNNLVHEHIELKSDTIQIKLNSSFQHNAVTDLNQFLQKVMKYSDLASQNKKTCTLFIVISKSLFAFFKTYFLQLGFLDGWRGLVIAVSNFNGKFFRYIKRYTHCKLNR